MRRVGISPSILSADLSNLERSIREVEKFSDTFHIDVMDGHFVPNITFAFPIIEAMKRITDVPLFVHLMITNPDQHLDRFLEMKPFILSFHYEACFHIDRMVNRIKSKGVKAFVALNPHTSVDLLKDFIEILDGILLMTVNPGFGGQKFIGYTMKKIRRLREIADELNPNLDIAVDGGINPSNVVEVARNGANIFIMGSSIFKTDDPRRTIENVRRRLHESGFEVGSV